MMASPERKIFGCPHCGFKVSGLEEACPRCGVRFTKEQLFECPFCGGKVRPTVASCPHCEIVYTGFTEERKEVPRKKSFDEVISELERSLSEPKKHPGHPRCPECSAPMTGPGGTCPKCQQKAEEVLFQCPLCGTPVGLSQTACPGCGAEFEAETVEEGPPAPEEDLPAPPEELGPRCPVCDAPAGRYERTCGVCGAAIPGDEVEKLEEVLEQFPDIAKEIEKAEAALAAQRAEESLADLEELAETEKEGIVTAPPPDSRAPAAGYLNGMGATNGVSNGLSNGRGRVNGRVNGRINGRINGRTNGRINGRINGRTNGRVNGQNLVNGTGVVTRGRGRAIQIPGLCRLLPVAPKWQFAVVVAAILIVSSTLVYISFAGKSAPFKVDGDFDDWDDSLMLDVATTAGSPTIDIEEWAVDHFGTKLYLYAEVQGDVFSTEDVESIFLFVDADGDADTGYIAGGTGAEFLLELDGWNGSVMMSYLFEYSSTTDRLDWNSWRQVSSLSHAIRDSRLEAMADLGLTLGPSCRMLLLAQDSEERISSSFAISPQRGTLIVQQSLVPQYFDAGIVPMSSTTALLRMTFSCQGPGGTVSQVTPTVIGAVAASTIQAFDIEPGGERVIDFTVDTSALLNGTFVSASVAEMSIQSTFTDVCIIGEGARAYVQSPPASVSIDGAFGDWYNRTMSTDLDLATVSNPNIDVDEVGVANGTAQSYFYISVDGRICCGKCVPAVRGKPVSGGGTPVVPARKTGEDFVRVYLDTDRSVSTGFRISTTEISIGADRMIEIRGLNACILERGLFQYSQGEWSEVSANIQAEQDDQRMEIGVNALLIGGDSEFDLIVEATDWRGRSDKADTTNAGGDGLKRWLVDSSTNSITATAEPFQRKLMFDGANFWSFYFDGSNTVHKYSSTGGQSWTSRGAVFKTSGVRLVSTWHDTSNNIVYAVGDTSTASTSVYLQRGTADPGTATITWAGSDSTLAASTAAAADKHTYICKDTSGYLWVLSSNCTQSTPVRYDLSAFRSASVDSISSWTHSGNMLSSVSAQVPLGSIVPAGSGSQVWSVYADKGSVYSRKFTGTWGSESTIFASSGPTGQTEVAPPCVVVTTNGVVHVVYGNDHEQPGGTPKPHIYYSYNRGSSWVTPIALSSTGNNAGFKSATISRDTSTGNVYAFWISMASTGGNAYAIEIVKNVSGTWTTVTGYTTTTDPKNYLTSIYSASGEWRICWQWTQNTSEPAQVVFEKIPEFNEIIVPVFFTGVIFIVCSIQSRRRSKKKRS